MLDKINEIDTQLNRVNFTKSLGVLIDENLTWSDHINAISKKISTGIGSIKRISHCVPPATLQNIFHGLVQSHFDYCSVVWGNCAKTIETLRSRFFGISREPRTSRSHVTSALA